ncbi:MAG: hypothetical protein JRI23_13615 [Deltaproteobacteria bacterium]|nr:hypothetical protein [Deltaproteobacteria bacterium]MBW2532766.1 hypothetical protein [Deltaproteobacteria bacterium]
MDRSHREEDRPAPRWLLRLGCVLALAFVTAVASAGDKAMAESLFQQGKAAMTAGNYAKACPLLDASLKEDRAVGTLLNLALCHEKQGKTATAWAEFREAAGMAERDDQLERAHGARKYAAKLERRLSTITIAVPEPVDGLVVTRAGRMIPPATYGVAVAADPGSYTIEASAPGHQGWATTIELGPRADRKTVTVPNLGSPTLSTGPALFHAEEPVEEPDDSSSGQDSGPSALVVSGVVIGGIGVISLGIGIALGTIAIGDTADLEDECAGGDERTGCPDEVLSRRDTVSTKADVATGTIIGGSVAAVAGLLMILLAPDDDPAADTATVRVAPPPAADRGGLGIAVSF